MIGAAIYRAIRHAQDKESISEGALCMSPRAAVGRDARRSAPHRETDGHRSISRCINIISGRPRCPAAVIAVALTLAPPPFHLACCVTPGWSLKDLPTVCPPGPHGVSSLAVRPRASRVRPTDRLRLCTRSGLGELDHPTRPDHPRSTATLRGH